MGPCLPIGCRLHSSDTSCGNQVHLVDHVPSLCGRVCFAAHASVLPVYGIAPYLEFRSNLEYMAAGRDHLTRRLIVRFCPLSSRPDCRWSPCANPQPPLRYLGIPSSCQSLIRSNPRLCGSQSINPVAHLGEILNYGPCWPTLGFKRSASHRGPSTSCPA